MPKVQTPRCLVCNETSVVELEDDEYKALGKDMLIQHALPNRDADFRELIMTGSHPKCWNKMFSDEE